MSQSPITLAQFGKRSLLAKDAIASLARLGKLKASQAYYALVIKLSALRAVYHQRGWAWIVPPPDGLDNAFEHVGLLNFVTVRTHYRWDSDIYERIGQAHEAWEPPAHPHDHFRHLYQDLIPHSYRHRKGEYYTPDWLAQHVLAQVRYTGEGRLLDPACGSGVFLVHALQQAQDFTTVVGYDVSPLAVQTARANYVLALGKRLPDVVEIPVYQRDTILSKATSQRFDWVVGNPPWVNWQDLPEGYRQRTRRLWKRYNLFPHVGFDTILGKGKKDLSMLLTCVVMDRYLAAGGHLGFVITQSAFKTTGAGEGFRRFAAGRVLHVDDMTDLRPFGLAQTRPAVLVMRQGASTTYPVPYQRWTGNCHPDDDYATVLQKTSRQAWVAEPVDTHDPTSAWITTPPQTLAALRSIIAPAAYHAHEGVNSGGANGVYWLEVLEQNAEGLVRVRNLVKRTRRRVEEIEAWLEPDWVYPLLRGRDVQRWQATSQSAILLVQDPTTRKGYEPDWLQQNYPLTYAYLQQFEEMLRGRSAFHRYFLPTDPFYSMFGVGAYTFAPYKVVWRYIAHEMTAAAICEEQVIIPDHRLMMVVVDSADEAHYLTACLNSSISRLIVGACTLNTQMSTHILNKFAIPRYDPRQHQTLADLARHASLGAEVDIAIDEQVAALFRLELRDLKSHL
ncbi:MAG: N-6 DNA methylase [Anaerolineales bacterium]|nr:N-6 DNA methylase [Anaerolineales bacterium]